MIAFLLVFKNENTYWNKKDILIQKTNKVSKVKNNKAIKLPQLSKVKKLLLLKKLIFFKESVGNLLTNSNAIKIVK